MFPGNHRRTARAASEPHTRRGPRCVRTVGPARRAVPTTSCRPTPWPRPPPQRRSPRRRPRRPPRTRPRRRRPTRATPRRPRPRRPRAPRRALGRGLRGLRLRRDGLEHELDDRHGRVVALAVTGLHDARVATGTVRDERGDLGEQLVHDRLVGDLLQHATTRVDVAALRERDEALGERLHALRLRLGRLDALVLEELRGQVREDLALVRRAAAETRSLVGLRHWCSLSDAFRVPDGPGLRCTRRCRRRRRRSARPRSRARCPSATGRAPRACRGPRRPTSGRSCGCS